MTDCARCGKPIPPEEHRKKYCSDACLDSATRERLKIRKAQLGSLAKVRWVRPMRYFPAQSPQQGDDNV